MQVVKIRTGLLILLGVIVTVISAWVLFSLGEGFLLKSNHRLIQIAPERGDALSVAQMYSRMFCNESRHYYCVIRVKNSQGKIVASVPTLNFGTAPLLTRTYEVIENQFDPPLTSVVSISPSAASVGISLGVVYSVILFIAVIVWALTLRASKLADIKNFGLQIALKESEAALGKLAIQVAHDIQSPLAALTSLQPELLVLPENARGVALKSIERIQGIAHDLLNSNRAEIGKVGSYRMSSLIEELIAEKKVQFSKIKNLSIQFNTFGPVDRVYTEFDSHEIQRIISNLLNNAVEAMAMKHNLDARIELNLIANDSGVSVEVIDSGTGIPPDILNKIGKRGQTYGKAAGSGLGLFHARTTIESWGGVFKIESEVGKGTRVSFSLPISAPVIRPDAILIDDDKLIHAAWKIAAKRKGKILKVYSNSEEFLRNVERTAQDAKIYIDSELGESQKGEEIAKTISEIGFKEIYLATGKRAKNFSNMPWLAGVSGKEPPWL